MQHQELIKKIAELEFTNDQLSSELAHLDRLMRAIGFSDGLRTVKNTAEELLEQEARGEEPPTGL